MNKRRLYIILSVVAGVCAVAAISFLLVGVITNSRQRQGADVAVIETLPPPTPIVINTTPPPAPAATLAPTEEPPTPTPKPTVPVLTKIVPELPEPWAPRAYDLPALRAKYGNDDIVAYLYIPGTSVDYPIAHTTDNVYYLKHNEYRKDNSAGALFMDYENNPAEPNLNTIIYGHNMKADTMFHAIRFYREENYYKKHKYVVFETDGRTDLYEVFAFYRARVDFNYTQAVFYLERGFLKLAEDMKKLAMYDTGITVGEGDVLLTLSTCTNDDADYRYVLTCVRVKDPSAVPAETLEKIYGAEAAATLALKTGG